MRVLVARCGGSGLSRRESARPCPRGGGVGMTVAEERGYWPCWGCHFSPTSRRSPARLRRSQEIVAEVEYSEASVAALIPIDVGGSRRRATVNKAEGCGHVMSGDAVDAR